MCDIVRREQEQIALLMDQKAAAEARVRELEKENEFLRNRIKTFTWFLKNKPNDCN